MIGPTLVGSAAFVLAVAGLGAGALSLANRLAPDGPFRLLAAVPIAAASAVLEALVLGRFGLGGSTVALTVAAVLVGFVIVRVAGAPRLRPVAWLSSQLRAAPFPVLIASAALAAAFIALCAVQLHRPSLGQDAITYHLAEAVGWVQSGHAGAVQTVYYGLPVGNYPVTEEVLLAWGIGLAHGFAPALLMTLAVLPLLWMAAWLGLAELGVLQGIRALAISAFSMVPLVVFAWVQPGTDLEPVAWLAVCAALCLAARSQPGLFAAAIVAGGLGVGTKTTALTYTVALLAVTAWVLRRELRAHWKAIAGGAALACGTGLVWYVRNWITHGAPLWPFSSFPDGDPIPLYIRFLSTSLLQRPQVTLFDHLGDYLRGLSGGVALIVLGSAVGVAGAVRRNVRLTAAGAVVAFGTLEYAAGPLTGVPPHEDLLLALVGTTLRYLLPPFAAGSVALAIATTDRSRPVAALGAAGLIGALVWSLVSDASSRFPLPYDVWLLVGAVVGALAAAVAALLLRRSPRSPSVHEHRSFSGRGRARGLALPAAATIAAVLVVAVASRHFSARQSIVDDFGQDIAAFMLRQPGYVDTDAPVATTRTGFATLAGDRLQHRLEFIPIDVSCPRVLTLHRSAWMLIGVPLPDAVRRTLPSGIANPGTAGGCLARAGIQPIYQDGLFSVFPPLRS